MKTPLTLLLLLYVGHNITAQTIIGRQLADQYPITSSGSKTYGLTWLPADYNSTTTNYPLIIFLHAAGEVGDGIKGLNNLINVGLPKKIAEGWDPQAVNPADGKTYKFIVVSPQAHTSSGWSYSYSHVKNILPDIISRYRIDTKRIYIIGISAGGAGTWSCVTNDSNFTKQIAAILPISSVGVNNPGVESPNIKYISGKYGVKVWTVCGTKDGLYNTAASYVNTINTAMPPPAVPAKLTGIAGMGHVPELWDMVFDALWRDNTFKLNFYEWMLQYQTDITLPSANQPPVADAGNDKKTILPKNTVTLSGSGLDPDGTISSYLWRKVDGPTQFTIETKNQPQTLVDDLEQGVYQFELRITDDQDASKTDTVTVTVLPKTNERPVANAGDDQTITLPTNSVSLSGSATDKDGTIESYLWTKIKGPDQFIVVSPNQPQTEVNDLIQHIYQFELKVTDNAGAVTSDTVAITVLPGSNQPPIANAGDDQTITLPTNSVLLPGSATDKDGTIESYLWTKIKGPEQFSIVSPDQPKTEVNDLIQHIYQFELKVTDNAGAVTLDTVTITVLPGSNQPPIANAGDDQNITLPTNSVLLSGSATDEDGTIESYSWAKISGPGQFTISNNSIATPVLSNLDAGAYIFRLTVTDNNGISATDDISVVVNPMLDDYKTVPAKIEAENYNEMIGVKTENTIDTGGGSNVGWIDNDDWMDFNVYVDSSGIYTANFRVAAANTGAKFQLRKSDGAVLTTVSVPNTGSYQGWITRSVVVSLSSGYQTLRIISINASAWNFNWMEFVRGGLTGKPVPAKIEAEAYDAMEGIQMEVTGDSGGGLDVGWINKGDWLDYNVNASSAGTYTVNFRVATPNTGAELQIQKQDGTMLAEVDIPKTGGYQTWSTVTATISIPEGEQTLRIISTEAAAWNFNWVQFVQTSGVIAQSTENISKDPGMSSLSRQSSSFEVTPNPVTDKFVLQVNSANTGIVKVQVVDMQGAVRKEFRFTKDSNRHQSLSLSAYGLARGMYIIRLQAGKWNDAKFILKL